MKPTEPNKSDIPSSEIPDVPPKDDDGSEPTPSVPHENRASTGNHSAEPLAKQIGETGDHTHASQDPTAEQQPAQGASSGKNAEENPDAQSNGTGEHVVHTTGLRADGGDFDATKPGAAQEAESKPIRRAPYVHKSSRITLGITDRGVTIGLLEEKHIRSANPNDSGDDESGNADGHGGKKGLGQRIKAKFRKH